MAKVPAYDDILHRPNISLYFMHKAFARIFPSSVWILLSIMKNGKIYRGWRSQHAQHPLPGRVTKLGNRCLAIPLKVVHICQHAEIAQPWAKSAHMVCIG